MDILVEGIIMLLATLLAAITSNGNSKLFAALVVVYGIILTMLYLIVFHPS